MSNKSPTFREKMAAARPDVVARQAKNAQKAEIAIKLRTLRDPRGMTQQDVAQKSGMSQSIIAPLEALTGPVPGLRSIEKYVTACNGYIDVVISPDKINTTEHDAA